MFQFHYGTIKRMIGLLLIIQKVCFNSTMVRLKAISATREAESNSCFNSTMVRLKDDETIRKTQDSYYSFNSTMVRLKGRFSLL